jgi:hypothetical protein
MTIHHLDLVFVSLVARKAGRIDPDYYKRMCILSFKINTNALSGKIDVHH